MSVLFRPRLWAAPSLCVFCGLSNRSGSTSRWLRGLTFRDPSSKSVFVPLALRGPASRVLSVSVRQCPVGWSLTSQTSPGLPRKILRGSHRVLWIRIRTFRRSSHSPVERKVWFPQELFMTNRLVGLSLEHMLLHFHSGGTAVSSF